VTTSALRAPAWLDAAACALRASRVTEQCKPFRSLAPALRSADAEKVRAALTKFGDKFYALRNQVVHQLWKEDETVCDVDDWVALSEFTISCVKFFYESYLSGPAGTRNEASFIA